MSKGDTKTPSRKAGYRITSDSRRQPPPPRWELKPYSWVYLLHIIVGIICLALVMAAAFGVAYE